DYFLKSARRAQSQAKSGIVTHRLSHCPRGRGACYNYSAAILPKKLAKIKKKREESHNRANYPKLAWSLWSWLQSMTSFHEGHTLGSKEAESAKRQHAQPVRA
uniref:Uncharacterized protein n=1 Tax=Cannabis sativa TaxID=3483 RepID=A0A803QSA5_CANSA